jgi:catechol 2,3-dioxygenase-like lactoylglutathione lyase family enzyme
MMNALSHIRQLDYTVIYARDLPAMRHFYEKVMEFPVINVLSERWIEFGIGSTRLALTVHGRFKDQPPPTGALSLQLAFRVPPAEVAKCAELLESRGVEMVLPVTDQAFGHRTVFFRDPDGNVLEIYAEI